MVRRPPPTYARAVNEQGDNEQRDKVTLEFDHAPGWLWRHVAGLHEVQKVVVVGITGPVGSGKSTLAQRLARESVSPPLVLTTDDYLPDYDRVAPLDRDLPEHADIERLARDLALLRAGRPAQIPVWSFHTHRREGHRDVQPAPLVICEGIHALHGHALPHLDVRVFVEAPREIRWARWEAIERQGQRGFGVEKAREHFNSIAEPSFSARAAEYARSAGVIVRNHAAPSEGT